MDGFVDAICFDHVYYSDKKYSATSLFGVGWRSDIQSGLSDIFQLLAVHVQEKTGEVMMLKIAIDVQIF